MDPFLVQRVWAGSLESPAAAAAITQPAAAATDDPFSPFTDSEVAAAAAGYFPLPPAHAQHHHHRGGLAPFPSSFLPGGGGMAAEEDVRFELLMTGVASLVVVGMWVGGLVLWYIYCIRRPPRLFCGACVVCVCVGGGVLGVSRLMYACLNVIHTSQPR